MPTKFPYQTEACRARHFIFQPFCSQPLPALSYTNTKKIICWKGKDIKEFKKIYNQKLEKKKKSKLVEHIYLSFTSLIDKAALLLVNLHLMLMSLFSLYPQKIFFLIIQIETELNVNREALVVSYVD